MGYGILSLYPDDVGYNIPFFIEGGRTYGILYYLEYIKLNGVELTQNESYFTLPQLNNTIEIKTRSGYKFTKADIRIFKSASIGSEPEHMTLSNNDTVAIINFNSNRASGSTAGSAYINGDMSQVDDFAFTESGAEYVDVTINKTNANVTPNNATIEVGVNYSYEITANNNYYFNSAPTMSYKDSDNNTVNITLTKVNDSKYTATVNLPTGSSDLVINAVAVAVPETATIQKTLTHASITPDLASVVIGTEYTFTINADNGYIFSGAVPKIRTKNNEGTIYRTINATKVNDYEYTITVTLSTGEKILQFVASAEVVPVPIETTSVTISADNCTVLPEIDTIEIGDTVNFTISADEGYIFDIVPVIRYKDREGSYITILPVRVSDYEYTCSVNLPTGATLLTISATANAESQTSEKYGAIQLHKIDKDALKSFEELHLFRGAGGGLEEIDITQYIASLKMCFVDVTTTERDNILVANINTHITADKVTDDNIILDLGDFNLTGVYGNALDIKYSEIMLTLPFIDVIKLDSAKVLNHTLNVKYSVNLITGACVALIYIKEVVDDTPNYILLSKYNGSMSFDIPFIKSINGEKTVIQNYNADILLNVPPKVTYIQKEKLYNNNVYDTFKKSTISSETGYFRCQKVNVNISCTANEKANIESLLKSGVYI